MIFDINSQVASSGIQNQTTSIAELCDQFIEFGYKYAKHSVWTMRTRATHIKQFSQYLGCQGIATIDGLSIMAIVDYFSVYGETHSKSTTNTSRRIIKAFLKWLSEYKEIEVRVKPETIKLAREPKKLPQAISIDTIRQVVSRCEEQDALMISFMVETGVRISEVVRIKWDDVIENSVFIQGKGEKERVVNITDAMKFKLAKHQLATGGKYVFKHIYNGYGEAMTKGTARVRIKKAFQIHAGVDMHPHSLRHTCAINLLKHGCDIITIQKQLGHRYVTTTQEYLQLTDSEREAQFKKHMKMSF